MRAWLRASGRPHVRPHSWSCKQCQVLAQAPIRTATQDPATKPATRPPQTPPPLPQSHSLSAQAPLPQQVAAGTRLKPQPVITTAELCTCLEDTRQALDEMSRHDSGNSTQRVQQVRALRLRVLQLMRDLAGQLGTARLPHPPLGPAQVIQAAACTFCLHAELAPVMEAHGSSRRSLSAASEGLLLQLVSQAGPHAQPSLISCRDDADQQITALLRGLKQGDTAAFFTALWALVRPAMDSYWTILDLAAAVPLLLQNLLGRDSSGSSSGSNTTSSGGSISSGISSGGSSGRGGEGDGAGSADSMAARVQLASTISLDAFHAAAAACQRTLQPPTPEPQPVKPKRKRGAKQAQARQASPLPPPASRGAGQGEKEGATGPESGPAAGAAARWVLAAVVAHNQDCRSRLSFQHCFVVSQGWIDSVASLALCEALTPPPSPSPSRSLPAPPHALSPPLALALSPAALARLVQELHELQGAGTWLLPPPAAQALDAALIHHGLGVLRAAAGGAAAAAAAAAGGAAAAAAGVPSPGPPPAAPHPAPHPSGVTTCDAQLDIQETLPLALAAPQAPPAAVLAAADLPAVSALYSWRRSLTRAPPCPAWTHTVMEAVLQVGDVQAASDTAATARALGLLPPGLHGRVAGAAGPDAEAAGVAVPGLWGAAAGSESPAPAAAAAAADPPPELALQVVEALVELLAMDTAAAAAAAGPAPHPLPAAGPWPLDGTSGAGGRGEGEGAQLAGANTSLLLNKLALCLACLPPAVWRERSLLTRVYPRLLQLCVQQLRQRPQLLMLDRYLAAAADMLSHGMSVTALELAAMVACANTAPQHMLGAAWSRGLDAAVCQLVASARSSAYMRRDHWAELLRHLAGSRVTCPQAGAALRSMEESAPELLGPELLEFVQAAMDGVLGTSGDRAKKWCSAEAAMDSVGLLLPTSIPAGGC